MIGKHLKDYETPASVTDLLDRLEPLAPTERAELEEQFKMSFYFGGQDVACIGTGPELRIIVAGVRKKVVAKIDGLTSQIGSVRIDFPPPWRELMKQVDAPVGKRFR